MHPVYLVFYTYPNPVTMIESVYRPYQITRVYETTLEEIAENPPQFKHLERESSNIFMREAPNPFHELAGKNAVQ